MIVKYRHCYCYHYVDLTSIDVMIVIITMIPMPDAISMSTQHFVIIHFL